MPAVDDAVTDVAGGIRFAVRATPRAARDAVAGFAETADGRTAISLRLKAPPVDGAANKALVRFLAKRLGVAGSAVRIVSGETARYKVVEVSGVTAASASRRLEIASN